MFGYVRTLDDELRLREYKAYRAIYCGLCRSLGKCTGRASRMTLSYDFVFLAILRYRAEGKLPVFGEAKCAGKRKNIAERDDVLDFCARAGALLTWYKLDDDLNDSRGLKRLGAGFLRHCARGMKKRADLPGLDAAVSERLAALGELERKMPEDGSGITPDMLADASGKLLAEVFSYGLDGDVSRIMYEAGLITGRWIYFADAADDLRDDLKNGTFNPFAAEKDRDPETLRCAMLLELRQLKATADLLPGDGGTLDSLAENIICLGMTAQTERVTGAPGGGGRGREKSGKGKLRVWKGDRI